jgi:hypothetical protein
MAMLVITRWLYIYMIHLLLFLAIVFIYLVIVFIYMDIVEYGDRA